SRPASRSWPRRSGRRWPPRRRSRPGTARAGSTGCPTPTSARSVATAGKWGRKMRSGHAQGFAINEEHRSAVAVLVEIDATDPKNPRVYKAVMAFDAGLPINPRGLEAQMLGGLNDGISTVLYAGNHLDNGVFRETSYTDFGYAKQRHYPINVEMYVMPKTTDEPGGAGETTVSAAGGAVANAYAYARATGSKPRNFPINF
ncbi:MAG: molybdopterin cofactor-binding domain-containing protein, partial [Pseudonocardiaceae bacterium]